MSCNGCHFGPIIAEMATPTVIGKDKIPAFYRLPLSRPYTDLIETLWGPYRDLDSKRPPVPRLSDLCLNHNRPCTTPPPAPN